VLAVTTVVSIAVAFIVVQRYAVEWRSASEQLQWEQLPPELTELLAADTIPMDRTTKLMQGLAKRRRVCPRCGSGHMVENSNGKLLALR
jgi:hypothetical protein